MKKTIVGLNNPLKLATTKNDRITTEMRKISVFIIAYVVTPVLVLTEGFTGLLTAHNYRYSKYYELSNIIGYILVISVVLTTLIYTHNHFRVLYRSLNYKKLFGLIVMAIISLVSSFLVLAAGMTTYR